MSDSPVTLTARGLELFQGGRFDEAEAQFRAAGKHPQALHLLGLLLHQKRPGDAEAVTLLTRAAKALPGDAGCRFNLGVVRQAAGDLEGAEAAYREALALRPDHPESWDNLGTALSGDEAVAAFDKALALKPEMASAWNNRGKALEAMGATEEAERSFRTALARNPAMGEALQSLGKLYLDLGRFEEAATCQRRRLELAAANGAGEADAWRDLGTALIDGGRFQEGLAATLEALKRDGGREAGTHLNLGQALAGLGEIQRAAQSAQAAAALNPEDPKPRFNLACFLLALGELAMGWDLYESRLPAGGFLEQREFGVPVWNGEELSGKRILVYGEQGVGDEIMFASCLPDLAARAEKVAVVCDGRLAPLFARSFPGMEILGDVARGEEKSAIAGLAPFDRVAPLGGLPRFLRRRWEDFPDRRGYLVPDPERVTHWREALDALGPGPKVGVSWRGGRKLSLKKLRSSALDGPWKPLLATPGVHWINLQYGESEAEASAAGIKTLPDLDRFHDLEGMAALMAALDLVISVDNATVHLGGAVGGGGDVWALLPQPAEWRWFLDREDAPWYPQGVRLFRQAGGQSWTPLFERVAERLRRDYLSEEE